MSVYLKDAKVLLDVGGNIATDPGCCCVVLGACCTNTGTCFDLSEADCTSFFPTGTWFPLATCEDTPYPCCPCTRQIQADVTVDLSTQCFTDCDGNPCNFIYHFSDTYTWAAHDLCTDASHEWVNSDIDVAVVDLFLNHPTNPYTIDVEVAWHFQSFCCGTGPIAFHQDLYRPDYDPHGCSDPFIFTKTWEFDISDGTTICGHATTTVTLTVT